MQDEDLYLHGFSETERLRLIGQAEVLGPEVFRRIDFSECRHIYEPGCGVGAQTLQLLGRYPDLKITCVEKSPSQFAAASQILQSAVRDRGLTVLNRDGMKTGLEERSFDGAFICWLLEHVPNPVGLLTETRRLLNPGATLFATEVFNPSLFFHPACPAISDYWTIFSDYQKQLGGDPYAGIRLGNYLSDAGFKNIEIWHVTFILDKREQDPAVRKAFLDYWWNLLMSAWPGLLAENRLNETTLEKMSVEYQKFCLDKDLVFYAAAMQARARA